MSTILLTWELGGGMGHMVNLRPIAAEFIRRGHKVTVAVNNLAAAQSVLARDGIAFIPAPQIPLAGPQRTTNLQGFTDILANIGFADAHGLAAAFSAWNALFDTIRPDLIIADHSPTALLACWGRPERRVNIGLGFFCPPEGFPLPFWLPSGGDHRAKAAQIAQEEFALTRHVNQLLAAHRRPALPRLCDIFTTVDEVFLATYPEFDHYGARPQARYWGHWPFEPGLEPKWPGGNGPRVYAYLKPFPGLEDLLAALAQSRRPTLVFAGGVPAQLCRQFACPTLRFEHEPLDLRQVSAQCDLAITNGNHGTAAAMLLAGVPCVLVPRFLEQRLFSQRVEAMGAGRCVGAQRGIGGGGGGGAGAAVEEVVGDGRYRAAAEGFAGRYAGGEAGRQVAEVVERMEGWVRVGGR